MAKLTESDKYFIQNNRKLQPKELALAIEKPLKLVAEYITQMPPIEDFEVKPEVSPFSKPVHGVKNTTVMTNGAAEAMNLLLKKGKGNPNYADCIQQIKAK